MRHHPVTSSRIASVGYDPQSRTLEIRFHDKRTFQYHEVPERILPFFLPSCRKAAFMMAW